MYEPPQIDPAGDHDDPDAGLPPSEVRRRTTARMLGGTLRALGGFIGLIAMLVALFSLYQRLPFVADDAPIWIGLVAALVLFLVGVAMHAVGERLVTKNGGTRTW
jgi:hypothetical protein